LNFSKKESDVIAKMRGTFDEGEKARRDNRRRLEESIFPTLYLYVYRATRFEKKEEVNRQVVEIEIRHGGYDGVEENR